ATARDPEHALPGRGARPGRGSRLAARGRAERDRRTRRRPLRGRGVVRGYRAPVSAIYGLVRLDDRAVEADELETMRRPMSYWGPDGGGIWRDGGAGLGQLVAVRTPEDEHEGGPLQLPSGTAVTAAGRLDNRQQLCRDLGVP